MYATVEPLRFWFYLIHVLSGNPCCHYVGIKVTVQQYIALLLQCNIIWRLL